MDGFAVRADDFRQDGAACLRIAQQVAAGQVDVARLRPREAARITTGAPLPPGADLVVMQKDAQVTGDTVEFRPSSRRKPHIRRGGEDIVQGTPILEAGRRIGPGQVALMAALGVRSLLARPRPRVALLSTGDELVEMPGALGPGRIHDSNRPMLARMIQATGAEVTDLGIVRDDPEAIARQLVRAAGEHDLLISSGGASVGFTDHLAQIISRRGYLEFWQLAMRPGKPIGFGDVDDCPMLLLSGNPLAAAAGFALIGRAILVRLEGVCPAGSGWHLPVTDPLTKPAGRTQILLGRLRHDPPGRVTMVEPLPDRGSASLRYLALADVMIVLHPAQTEITKGDPVEVVPVWQALPP